MAAIVKLATRCYETRRNLYLHLLFALIFLATPAGFFRQARPLLDHLDHSAFNSSARPLPLKIKLAFHENRVINANVYALLEHQLGEAATSRGCREATVQVDGVPRQLPTWALHQLRAGNISGRFIKELDASVPGNSLDLTMILDPEAFVPRLFLSFRNRRAWVVVNVANNEATLLDPAMRQIAEALASAVCLCHTRRVQAPFFGVDLTLLSDEPPIQSSAISRTLRIRCLRTLVQEVFALLYADASPSVTSHVLSTGLQGLVPMDELMRPNLSVEGLERIVSHGGGVLSIDPFPITHLIFYALSRHVKANSSASMQFEDGVVFGDVGSFQLYRDTIRTTGGRYGDTNDGSYVDEVGESCGDAKAVTLTLRHLRTLLGLPRLAPTPMVRNKTVKTEAVNFQLLASTYLEPSGTVTWYEISSVRRSCVDASLGDALNRLRGLSASFEVLGERNGRRVVTENVIDAMRALRVANRRFERGDFAGACVAAVECRSHALAASNNAATPRLYEVESNWLAVHAPVLLPLMVSIFCTLFK